MEMALRWLSVILLLLARWDGEAARVLMVPLPLDSHIRGQVIIGRELARRGHDVHMLFSQIFHLPKDLMNQSNIVMHFYENSALEDDRSLEKVHTHSLRNLLENTNSETRLLLFDAFPTFSVECRRLLEGQDELFQQLTDLKFDMAIVDGLFPMKCLFMVPHRLRIPWISLAGTVEPWLVRLPYLPSFASINMGTTFTERMTFIERLQNTVITGILTWVSRYLGPPQALLDEYQKYGSFDDLNDLASKTLLWIALRHAVADYAKPSMPKIVDNGGLSIQVSTQPLPVEFDDFISGAKSGSVVITFGSMVADLPSTIVAKFIAAFRGLPDYRFFWRFSNKQNLALPENVWAAGWLPQDGLLAHPHVRLFITHAGYNGLLESIYHATPMIVFPLFGDQHYNARCMAYKGYALQMDIHAFTAEQLMENIRTVASNPGFKDKVTRASEIFRSDAQKPLEKTIWWVEHVIRFGGDHLRSAGDELAWYEYWMLDVLAVLCMGVALAVLLTCATCRCVFRRCCRRRPPTAVKPESKKPDSKKKK